MSVDLTKTVSSDRRSTIGLRWHAVLSNNVDSTSKRTTCTLTKLTSCIATEVSSAHSCFHPHKCSLTNAPSMLLTSTFSMLWLRVWIGTTPHYRHLTRISAPLVCFIGVHSGVSLELRLILSIISKWRSRFREVIRRSQRRAREAAKSVEKSALNSGRGFCESVHTASLSERFVSG